MKINPELDLVLDRVVDVPCELVWKAWTTPEQIVQWFTPAPWKTVECDIDLVPGGAFRTVMESPEGQRMEEGESCYLKVEAPHTLVWTSVLGPGFRPQEIAPSEDCSFGFTACLTFTPEGSGTRYVAHVMHADAAGKKQHEEMGFQDGWGTCLDQLVAMIKSETINR